METMESVVKLAFLIIPALIILGLGGVGLFIYKHSFLSSKYREKMASLISTASKIKGTIDDCITFSYVTKSGGGENSSVSYDTHYIYFPIIRYLDQNNVYKLIACSGSLKRGSMIVPMMNRIKYEDIGKSVTIAFDPVKIKKLEIDLENGIFLGKKYANKIGIGDYAQARKGSYIDLPDKGKIFVTYNSKVYLLRDEHDFLEYTKNLNVVDECIIAEFQGEFSQENYIETKIQESKKVFKVLIPVLAVIAVIIAAFAYFLVARL